MTASDDVAARSGLQRLQSAPVWIAAILAALTVFGPLSMDLYLPVLPGLAADLRSTTSAAQLTLTTCLIGLAAGQLIAGPLSDRYGRRRPLLVGLTFYTAASALCAFSTTIELLVAFRLLQGIAGGVGLVIAQAAGRDLYSGARLNRYYGRIVVLSGLAAVVAPIIGGLLALAMEWRGFFVLLAGIGVVVTAVVAVGFGETLAAESRVTGGLRQTFAHLGTLANDRLFAGATVASSLTSAAYFGYLAAAPFVLQDVYGLEPTQFAVVFAINAAGFAGFGFLAGRAAERWTERRVFAVGLALIGLGAAGLVAAAGIRVPLALVVAAFFLVSAGAATVSPPSTTLALIDHPQYAGTASSVLGLSRFGAGAVAAPLVGLAGSFSLVPLAWVIAGTSAAAVAVFASLVLPRRQAI